MNSITDGDDGSNCGSPYHNLDKCPRCISQDKIETGDGIMSNSDSMDKEEYTYPPINGLTIEWFNNFIKVLENDKKADNEDEVPTIIKMHYGEEETD